MTTPVHPPSETEIDPFLTEPRVSINGDYHFTNPEKQELGMKLATLYTRREEILAHKKDLMAQINAQAATVDAEIKGVSNKIRSGFEPREMQAICLYHMPDKGKKSYFSVDSRALIRTEMMLPSDFERELPLEKTVAAPPVVPPPPAGASRPENEAGVTSLADALNAAALGTELKPVPFDVDPQDEPKAIARKFAKAAGAFGWPQAAIAILRDEVKKLEVAHRAIETLSPHITPKNPPAPENTPASPTPPGSDGEQQPTEQQAEAPQEAAESSDALDADAAE
jgi:hypothetical protein